MFSSTAPPARIADLARAHDVHARAVVVLHEDLGVRLEAQKRKPAADSRSKSKAVSVMGYSAPHVRCQWLVLRANSGLSLDGDMTGTTDRKAWPARYASLSERIGLAPIEATTARFPCIGLGQRVKKGGVAMADKKTPSPSKLGPRRRLSARAQHADRRCVADAAGDLGLRDLARHARLHHRRLDLARGAAHRAPGRHLVLQRLPCHRRRHRAHLPDVAVPCARRSARSARVHRADRHLSALRLPRHLVDRLRLRLLVEPDRGRGGDAHGACGPAGGRARRRGRRSPRGSMRCKVQLDNVVTWSDSQMAREETSGGSCGTPSGAGRGPLYNARGSVRDQIASLRDGVQTSWLGARAGRHRAAAEKRAPSTATTVAERQQRFEASGERTSVARPATSPRAPTSSASRRRPRCAPSRPRSSVAPGAERLLLLRPDARRSV